MPTIINTMERDNEIIADSLPLVIAVRAALVKIFAPEKIMENEKILRPVNARLNTVVPGFTNNAVSVSAVEKVKRNSVIDEIHIKIIQILIRCLKYNVFLDP